MSVTSLDSDDQLLDPRLSSFGKDIPKWRAHLRDRLYIKRRGLSDLSGFPLTGGFDAHECLIPRAVVPRGIKWHYMIFHEINVLLLTPDEHIPQPPTRIESYWLAVMRYGMGAVNGWIDSLPWKVRYERPWAGTRGWFVINNMCAVRDIGLKQWTYYTSKRDKELNCVAE